MKLSFAILLLAGTAVSAADVPLDVRTGEWEYTVTTQMNNVMPASAQGKQMPQIPADQLAKMPPDVRARIEAQMKQAQAAMSGQPQTNTNKNCIKKEDLANMNLTQNMDKSCKTTMVSATSRKMEMKMDCDNGSGMKQAGKVVVDAPSSDTLKFSIDMSGTNNNQPMSMKINGTGKWLSATCSEK